MKGQDADYPYPSLSPKGTISQIVGNTLISIEYERPSSRKRQIFGELVPWGKVWRTGAGNCTKISFNKDVIVGGQKVKAGKYSLFTIPNPKEWIVILNSDTSLYGSFDYNSEKDVARFPAIPTQTGRFYETLNFDIELVPNNAKIFISWANVQVGFNVETTTDEEIEEFIQSELLSRKNKDSDIYAGAAEYLFYQNKNLMDALKLADFAIELNPDNGWARLLKVRIYKKLKQLDKAFDELKEGIEHIQSAEYKDEKERQNSLRQFRLEYKRIVRSVGKNREELKKEKE
ncbi:MAG: DUF2911 domain-containing protein [Allomuricauda sp.]